MPIEPAIDCHVHVFDPARFPYGADAWYRPLPSEAGTAVQLAHLLDTHHVRHALIVGPNSGYGLDNRCLLDALAQGRGRYKGVAVVPNDASASELQDLQAQGVVGVAFKVAAMGSDRTSLRQVVGHCQIFRAITVLHRCAALCESLDRSIHAAIAGVGF
jgi:predicted TIM-barrel fold metal-dependent hydrolase